MDPTLTTDISTAADQFWQSVDTSGGPDACWPWDGNRCDKTSLDGAQVRVAHAAWVFADGGSGIAGIVPDGKYVGHIKACRNRRCCNPAHLVLKDGWKSMKRRGRPRKVFDSAEAYGDLRRHVEGLMVRVDRLEGQVAELVGDGRVAGDDVRGGDFILTRPPLDPGGPRGGDGGGGDEVVEVVEVVVSNGTSDGAYPVGTGAGSYPASYDVEAE